jgi:hypothetical protein
MRTIAIIAALAAAVVAAAGAQTTPTAAPPTPRMSDGKPDLSGVWTGRARGGRGGRDNSDPEIIQQVASRRCAPGQHVDGLEKGNCVNQTLDQEFVREDVIDGNVVFSGRWDANKPIYKPEFWDRIQELDQHTNTEDPILKCQPQGLTRVGMPERIVQLPNEIILFYAGNATSPRDFRMIPTDGRMHPKGDNEAVTFWGRSVGTWNGDTLVIDSVGFNDLTWLARGGLFHSEKLHVIERFRREGNVLHYAVTAEDPEVLLQPWVLPERQIGLNTNPNAGFIAESEPCVEYEADELAAGSHIRH